MNLNEAVPALQERLNASSSLSPEQVAAGIVNEQKDTLLALPAGVQTLVKAIAEAVLALLAGGSVDTGGIIGAIGDLLGNHEPSYTNAVKRVGEALAKAMAGDRTGGNYHGITVTDPPVAYLGHMATGSKFPEARTAAIKALAHISDEGPDAEAAEAEAILAGLPPATVKAALKK